MVVALAVTFQSFYSHVTKCKIGLTKLTTSSSICRRSWYPIWELYGSEPGIVNPLTTNVSHHIETSQLICIANMVSNVWHSVKQNQNEKK